MTTKPWRLRISITWEKIISQRNHSLARSKIAAGNNGTSRGWSSLEGSRRGRSGPYKSLKIQSGKHILNLVYKVDVRIQDLQVSF